MVTGRNPRPSSFRFAFLLAALTGLSCAHAVNYADTAGPIYTGARAATARAASPRADSAASDTMRVVTFNIEYAVKIDGALELLREEPALRAPDLLCLQEMDTLGTQKLARALGMNYVYAPSGVHPKYKRDFGCAILSPWPLENPRKILLPHEARVTGLRRAAVSATLVREGRRVLVYSLHLPSPLGISGGSRRDQVKRLAADVDSMMKAGNGAEKDSAAGGFDAVILAGDFNSKGICEELAEAGFTWSTRHAAPSARLTLLGVDLLHLHYDHVLVRGLTTAPGPDSLGVIADNRGVSDHQPVWIRLLPGASSP
ncbi:MAG TPA: endonuclease/exonuclease/phosphatase family protein [Candidatus Eisenbacteria bacterium]|nr:endonuclease/exonuclease/phosphatase family protein [Candidatus Eisenbacteria bacterium]